MTRCLLITFSLIVALAWAGCSSAGHSNGGTDGDLDDAADGDIITVDGDTIVADGDVVTEDGDSVDEDSDSDASFDCSGNCVEGEPAACIGADRCVCTDNILERQDCEAICRSQGLGENGGCGFNSDLQQYDCRCEKSPEICIADFIIDELPYSHQGDTSGKENRFGFSDSCFDWAVPGSDAVYRVALQTGHSYILSVSPIDKDYDVALVVASSCSNFSECLGGSDHGWAGASEQFTYSPARSGTVWIVIDSGYKIDATQASGKYLFKIEDTTASPDGDASDGDIVDGDFLDGDIADGDGTDQEQDTETDSDLVTDGDIDIESDPDTDEDVAPDGDSEADLDQDVVQDGDLNET
jgi:hypothetical protein